MGIRFDRLIYGNKKLALEFYRCCVHACAVRIYRPTCMTHKCEICNEKVIEFMLKNVKSFDEMRIDVINFGQKFVSETRQKMSLGTFNAPSSQNMS